MTLTLDAPRPTTTNLLPALFARSWIKHQRLSDDGFCDSLATIQLSPNLSMALVFPGQRTFRRLSHRGLADLACRSALWRPASPLPRRPDFFVVSAPRNLHRAG